MVSPIHLTVRRTRPKHRPERAEHGKRFKHRAFLIVLWRNLKGEKMAVKFEPAAGGETGVTISGAVAGAKHQRAADRVHWTYALGASAV